MSTAERITAVDSDGFTYDIETGEVLGCEGVADAWRCESSEDADLALEIRSKIEGDLAGVSARLKAVTEQLHALRRQHERRLAWWEWRFGSALIAFARTQLHGRARTVRFGWGSVSFRRTAGSRQIVDMAGAVEWVRLYRPDLVQVTERVNLSAIDEAQQAATEVTGEDERLPFLVVGEPGETITISTGVETR